MGRTPALPSTRPRATSLAGPILASMRSDSGCRGPTTGSYTSTVGYESLKGKCRSYCFRGWEVRVALESMGKGSVVQSWELGTTTNVDRRLALA